MISYLIPDYILNKLVSYENIYEKLNKRKLKKEFLKKVKEFINRLQFISLEALRDDIISMRRNLTANLKAEDIVALNYSIDPIDNKKLEEFLKGLYVEKYSLIITIIAFFYENKKYYNFEKFFTEKDKEELKILSVAVSEAELMFKAICDTKNIDRYNKLILRIERNLFILEQYCSIIFNF